jgi:lycopene cyclase CruP
MERLGDPVLKPFLQDVVQFPALFGTLVGMVATDPVFAVGVLAQIGPLPTLDWLRHFLLLGAYDALHRTLGGPLAALARAPILGPRQRLSLKLTLAAWQYGSGNDYSPSSPSPKTAAAAAAAP